MFSEDPILLPEIVDQIVLVTVHPASEREDEELQRRRHSLRLLGRLDQHRPSLGRFFAPYEVNVSKALLSAEADLADDPQAPPDRTVDDDWLFRWRDAASVVSSEELQTLWGRVLAGEIKSPGSFSLRTLEFLKHISHEEALQIAKLAPFVLSYGHIFNDRKLLDSEGITFSFLLDLQNLGVTCGVDSNGLLLQAPSENPDKFKSVLVSHDRALVVTHEDASK